MASFNLKEGDTSPSLLYTLSPATVELTGATVVFNMTDQRGNVKVSRASATVTDVGDGTASGTPTVRYDWVSADTDTSGVYLAEFEVTYADSSVETFPNSDNITVVIMEDLA